MTPSFENLLIQGQFGYQNVAMDVRNDLVQVNNYDGEASCGPLHVGDTKGHIHDIKGHDLRL